VNAGGKPKQSQWVQPVGPPTVKDDCALTTQEEPTEGFGGAEATRQPETPDEAWRLAAPPRDQAKAGR